MSRWLVAVAIGLGAWAAPVPATAATCPASPFDAELDVELRRRFPAARFSASVLDLRDGCTYELHPGRSMTTASVFKVQLLAGVLLRAQAEGRDLTTWEMARVRPMISESANSPASELFTSLGGAVGANRLAMSLGMRETSTSSGTWGLTRTTASDQVHLLRQLLVGGGPLGDAARRRAVVELHGVIPSQRWGITEGVPAGWPVALKNGFAPSPCCGWRLNSVGQVGHAWLVATFGDGWATEAAGIEGNRFLNGAIAARLARVPVGPFPSAEAFAERQFHDLLGRPSSLVERISWSSVLHQGGDPAAAVALLFGHPVARQRFGDDIGLALLGRSLPPANDRIGQIAAVLASTEYRLRVGR